MEDLSEIAIPAHIPEDRVIDFDLYYGPEVNGDPYLNFSKFHDGPDIFYTPRNGGHWVTTRARIAREIMEDSSRFSVDAEFNPRLEEDGPRLIPAQVDPPIHTKYRKLLNRPLSPAAVANMADSIQAVSQELIESVRPAGGCDFFSQISQHFPIAIFMKMADLPFSDRHELIRIADQITHDPTPGAHVAGIAQLADYLRPTVIERRLNPGEDLISTIASVEIDGEIPPIDDIIDLVTNIVLGGLDTVVSGLAFIIGYLARNPEKYESLVDGSANLKSAVEEMLRVFGVANMERCAISDMELHGVNLKKFDRFIIIPAMYNVDPDLHPDPLQVDFGRTQRSHMTFGAGPHHCAGAHLARLEIRIFLEEWIKAFPEFGLAPGETITTIGGFVLQPTLVPLAWDVSKTHRPVAS